MYEDKNYKKNNVFSLKTGSGFTVHIITVLYQMTNRFNWFSSKILLPIINLLLTVS